MYLRPVLVVLKQHILDLIIAYVTPLLYIIYMLYLIISYIIYRAIKHAEFTFADHYFYHRGHKFKIFLNDYYSYAGVFEDTKIIYFNKMFWNALSTEQRRAVLLHEVGHVMRKTIDCYKADEYAFSCMLNPQVLIDILRKVDANERADVLARKLAEREQAKKQSNMQTIQNPGANSVKLSSLEKLLLPYRTESEQRAI